MFTSQGPGNGRGRFLPVALPALIALLISWAAWDWLHVIKFNIKAEILRQTGVYGHAVANSEAYLSESTRRLGESHFFTRVARSGLAYLYLELGRFNDAKRLRIEAVAVAERHEGSAAETTLRAKSRLASLLESQGDFEQAEQIFTAVVETAVNAYPITHPVVERSVERLVVNLISQGRVDAAVEVAQRYGGASNPWRGLNRKKSKDQQLNDLAYEHLTSGKPEEALKRFIESLAFLEQRHGPDHPDVADQLSLVALTQGLNGQSAAAEETLSRQLAIQEAAYGRDSHKVADPLASLAMIDNTNGQHQRAYERIQRVVRLNRTGFVGDSPGLAAALAKFAIIASAARQPGEAQAAIREATEIARENVSRLGDNRSDPEFSRHLRIVFQLLLEASTDLSIRHGINVVDETFELGQQAELSAAAIALQQLSGRFSTGNSTRASDLRLRQDLVTDWNFLERRLFETATSPAKLPGAVPPDELRVSIETLKSRIREVDDRMRTADPTFATLAHQAPIPIEAVRELLREDEAVVMFVPAASTQNQAGRVFVWAITKDEAVFAATPTTTTSLIQSISTLRCGLDEEEWSSLSSAARCGASLAMGTPTDSDPLPFHLGVAHALYQDLFTAVETSIRSKRLLIVPSGPLTSLPFHVLVAEKPEKDLPGTFEGYRNVRWLGRMHSISVLPSIASIEALRRNVKASTASRAYIGYGNPKLDGDGSCQSLAAPPECPGKDPTVNASLDDSSASAPIALRAMVRSGGGRRSPSLGRMFTASRGSSEVLANVRALCPLPDTAYEIRCVADRLGAGSDIRLDSAATESDVKAMSRNGSLASFRIVHFATHGLLAGDVEAMAKRRGEPALVMTPPIQPLDVDDDGLLTASEVATLRLDADWVVLSACNTASAGKPGAEALSGLARSFFYAGARALLVSHWPVYSDAAVRLATEAFAAMQQAPIGRADALQRAMQKLMDDRSQADNAHPAVWAPFVLVGEGGSTK
ncbi:MAG: CHAT domain-containing tetratricopeptide repeat protein [Hyphomicrobium sp.]